MEPVPVAFARGGPLMRRILILIKGLGRGGAEQIIASSVPYLSRDRFLYEVAFVRPDRNALVAGLRSAGIEVTCLGRGGSTRGWVGRLRHHLERRRVDLVHAHLPVAAIGARLVKGRRPLVYTEHNVWPSYVGATRRANMLTYARNDLVFAVSDEVRRSIRYPNALRWRRMPRVETLRHGIDVDPIRAAGDPRGVREELGIDHGAPVAVTVANFRREKGHGTLVRTIEIVRRRVPDARFVLVGQGPLEPEIRRAVADAALDDAVVFAGFRTDVPRLVAAADVFVLPSDFEGLPISLIEAMALGRPSVVTGVGGIPEVVDGDVEAIVVRPKDADALAAGLLTLFDDPERRDRMGAAARRRADGFHVRHAVHRLEGSYEDLLA